MKTFLKYAIKLAVALAVMVIIWSCTKVPGLKEETTGSFIRIPFVRILLSDNSSAYDITGEGSFAVECLTGDKQSIYYSSHPVKIVLVGSWIKVYNHKGNLIQDNLDEVNIIPRGNDNRLITKKSKYRGLIKFLPNGVNLEMINIVYMEDYLKGVVPPEIGTRIVEEIEAVKAQAIAARTYAMAHLQQYKGKPYDMKSSIVDQVYEGFSVENDLTNQAIESTMGEVLFYNDQYIDAYYHSTCGGMTDDINAVWDRKQVPYLKAVKDDDACNWSKYFNWTEVFTEQQLRGRIEQYMSSDRGRDLRIGKINDIQILTTTPGGRIDELIMITEYDRFSFKKDRIRWVIGRTSNPDLILPSDRFNVELSRNRNGILEKITFTGKGYGHGVGMCQCGAIGLSRKGWTYRNILTHYYTGVELKKLY